jgi:hypothetical protein
VTDNLPAEVRADATQVTRRAPNVTNAQLATTRPLRELPPYAYRRPGLGDLPLSARVRDAQKVLDEVLTSVERFEALTPQALECSVCGRNLAGWPDVVLVDHWFQHSWVQRRLAAANFVGR